VCGYYNLLRVLVGVNRRRVLHDKQSKHASDLRKGLGSLGKTGEQLTNKARGSCPSA